MDDFRPVDGIKGVHSKWVGISVDPKDKTILNVEATKPFGFNVYGHGINRVFWIPGYVCQWARSKQYDTFLKIKLDKEITGDISFRYIQSGTLVIKDMDDMYLPHDFECSLTFPVAKENPPIEEAVVVPPKPEKPTVILPVAKEPQKKKPAKKV